MSNNAKSRSKYIIAAVILVVFAGLIYNTITNIETVWQDITPEELSSRMGSMGNKDFILVDVRTPEEFNGGHIPGAISIPVDDIENEISKLDHDKEIILYCRSGNRSARAASILSGYGFKDIKNMSIGIQGWKGKIIMDETSEAFNPNS